MTTVQIIGIAVASLAVLLLIVALIVTRRRGDQPDEEPRAAASSFLDEAPQDTFSGLGKPEQPVEDITLDPGWSGWRRPGGRGGRAGPAANGSPRPAAWASTGART